jgi:hypothetical protein
MPSALKEKAMPFCFKCGSEIGDHMDFCPKCGTRQGTSPSAGSGRPAPPTTPSDSNTVQLAGSSSLEEILPPDAENFSGIGLKSINCKNCGGTLLFDPSTPISTCSFCGSQFLLQTATDRPLTEPLWIVPFEVKKNDFRRLLLSWMIEGDHTPNDILEKAEIAQPRAVFAPFFIYDIEWSTNWSASIGHWREEHYQEWVTPWGSDKKVLKDKVRRVTDWSPLTGRSEGLMKLTLLASKRLPRELQFIGGSVDKAQVINQKLLSGVPVEPFEVTPGDRLKEEKENIAADILDKVAARLPGDEKKDLCADNAILHSTSKRCLLPAWMVKYKYGDSEYEVFVDGSSGVVKGGRPESASQKEAARSLYAGFKKLAIIFGSIVGGWAILALIIVTLFANAGPSSESEETFDHLFLTPCCCTWLVVLLVFGVILWNKYSVASKHEKDAIEHGLAVRKKSLEDRLKSEGL